MPAPAYPTVNEFRRLLARPDVRTIVEEHVLSNTVPYAFRNRPRALATLRAHLADQLGVDHDQVLVVGSGRIGFSLNPANFPRSFGPFSDLDVVIINQDLFDLYWHTMLRWNYPRRGRSPLAGRDRTWRRDRQRDLYWGWFRPDYIRYDGLSLPSVLRPLRDLSAAWFNAFQSLGQYPILVGRTISGRLYRTRELAILYHTDGLEKLRESLHRNEDAD